MAENLTELIKIREKGMKVRSISLSLPLSHPLLSPPTPLHPILSLLSPSILASKPDYLFWILCNADFSPNVLPLLFPPSSLLSLLLPLPFPLPFPLPSPLPLPLPPISPFPFPFLSPCLSLRFPLSPFSLPFLLPPPV